MHRPWVKSASRTLQVLELFSEKRRQLKLHEICDAIGLPQSSGTHLMKSMLGMGYVNYNRNERTYLPTNKVANLGGWLSSTTFGHSRLDDLASRLRDATDETVAIATQNDLFIQYTIIKLPQHEFKMREGVGNMRLITNSTSGVALLSQMSDREAEKLCRHINYYQSDPKDRVDLVEILREVRWTREVGYCYRKDHPQAGIASVAFPLRETLHGIPLALGVGGLKSRLDDRLGEVLKTARDEIAMLKSRSEVLA